MINFADVKTALQARMEEVRADLLLVPVAYENGPYDPDTAGDEAYARFAVVEQQSQAPVDYLRNDTAAARLMGTIHVLVAVKAGTGDAVMEATINNVKAQFQGQTIAMADGTRIRVQNATGAVAGRKDAWFQKLIALPFVADRQAL